MKMVTIARIVIAALVWPSAFVIAKVGLIPKVLRIRQATPSPATRISHGFLAGEGQFPWQAGLLIVSKTNTVSVGGGTVISDEWVLTAGHCISSAAVVTITLGTVDRFSAAVEHPVLGSSSL